MANPFDKQPPALNPKRNTFDLSFANNLTLPIGKLVPVMCEEVLPGDTFKIQPDFGLRFQPMAFPVQTRMRCDIHFFYVRNRNLWNNWKKFIGRTDETVAFPVIGSKPQGSEFYQVGSLADYLGVPTTYAGRTQREQVISNIAPSYGQSTFLSGIYPYTRPLQVGQQVQYEGNPTNAFIVFPFPLSGVTELSIKGNSIDLTEYGQGVGVPTDFALADRNIYLLKFPKEPPAGYGRIISTEQTNTLPPTLLGVISSNEPTKVLTDAGIKLLSELDGLQDCCLGFSIEFGLSLLQSLSEFASKTQGNNTLDNCFQITINSSTESVHTSDRATQVFDPAITPISALPFRAYRYIWNAWYRNEQVDPLIIDGKPEYDIFLENMGDGEDDFPYQLENRYWEKDPFTTALPSPQMGEAPLVGGRVYGETQQQPNVRGTITTNEGDTIDVTSSADGKLLSVSSYDNNTPISTIEALRDAINFGISINDFRNVSALQQWLEINVRRGYRYKEQIMSHFGVHVSYEELDMPEFIGAISKDVNVSTIYNQTSEGGTLGDYAGVASALGQSKYKISKYCDEHGFIMAIMSISPIPTYPQMLKKHFTKLHAFDYFFPEFGHIGLQPIPIKELTPLQVEAQAEAQNETFGYQRAWYEYVGKVDEVHGQFRTDMKNYLITRNFISAPQLDGDFLKIKEDEVNDVFVYTKGTDKALGQVYFKITAKRPIPYFGVPRIV